MVVRFAILVICGLLVLVISVSAKPFGVGKKSQSPNSSDYVLLITSDDGDRMGTRFYRTTGFKYAHVYKFHWGGASIDFDYHGFLFKLSRNKIKELISTMKEDYANPMLPDGTPNQAYFIHEKLSEIPEGLAPQLQRMIQRAEEQWGRPGHDHIDYTDFYGYAGVQPLSVIELTTPADQAFHSYLEKYSFKNPKASPMKAPKKSRKSSLK